MIKLFKILLKAMIEVGSTIITAITIGSTAPTKIDWGSDKVWPESTPTHSITISPTAATNVSSAGTDAYIYVTASTNSWTVSTTSSWITVAKDSNSRARYWVDANTSASQRTGGVISFMIDGVTYATFTVSQQAGQKILNINPNTLSGLTYGASAGTITVTTNISNWGVWITYMDPNTNWLTVSKQGSTGVSWSVTENTSDNTRIATFDVSGDGLTRTVYVRQTAGYVWNISSTGASVSSAAGYYQVTVNSSYQGEEVPVISQVNVNTMNAQMTLASSGSAGYHIYNITYPQRTATNSGTFAASFRQSGTNQTLTFTLTQSGAAPSTYISINPTAITSVSSAGTTTSISVTASTNSWTATTPATWLTITKSSNSQLMVTVAEATSTSQRTGYVYFKIDDATYATLSITQVGKYVPPTPGEVVPKAYYGNWVIGTLKTSETTVPIGTVDVNGIVIVNENPITADQEATVSMVYQTGPYTSAGTPTSTTISDRVYTIPSGSTFSANGVTYNGLMIVSPTPRLQINQVSKFVVLPST